MFCYNFYHKGLRTAAVLIYFEINSPDVTKTYYFYILLQVQTALNLFI